MGQVWQLSVVACRGPRPRSLASSRVPPPRLGAVPPTAPGGVACSLTTPSPAAPLQITRDLEKGQCVRGCGKRRRFHVLYYQTSETGWVPATKLKDFEQNLEVPRPNALFVFGMFRIAPRTVGGPPGAQHCELQPARCRRPLWWP